MGRLLEDMTRLTEEIQALHESREMLRKELTDGNLERQMDVYEMCADFASTQARVAKRSKAGRLAFLNHLRRTVGGLQRDMGTDLDGVRRVWAGGAT
jgi:hypothetical protein